MLEGYKNYQYTLAVKNPTRKIEKKFKNPNNYFLSKYESYLIKYYNLCCKFHLNKTIKLKKLFIKEKKIFLLPILQKDAFKRFIKETYMFKKIYESR